MLPLPTCVVVDKFFYLFDLIVLTSEVRESICLIELFDLSEVIYVEHLSKFLINSLHFKNGH